MPNRHCQKRKTEEKPQIWIKPIYWPIGVWKHSQTLPMGKVFPLPWGWRRPLWKSVWAGQWGLLRAQAPPGPGAADVSGATCSEPRSNFLARRRHWGVVKGCGQGMINEEEEKKAAKNGECEKKRLNSDCSSITPQMGLTSVFSRRNKTSPLAIRGRISTASSWEKKK